MSDNQFTIASILPPGLPRTMPMPAGGLGRGPVPLDDAEKAAKDFESILLNKMLDEMAKTIPDSGLLDASITKQIRSMSWFYLAGELSRKGGLGLWKQLYGRIVEPSRGRPGGPGSAKDGL